MEASVPRRGVSDELRHYPENRLASPVNVTEASFAITPSAAPSAGAVPSGGAAPSAASDPGDPFAALISRQALSFSVVWVSLLASMGLGALHALSPGHGKTVVAAYLAGSRGTARHALFLGLIVSVTHTAGVFALGFAALFASRHVLPDRLYPWLEIVSGAILAALGTTLLARRARRVLGSPPHAPAGPSAHRHPHSHHGFGHHHNHNHDHHHRHDHGPGHGPDEAPRREEPPPTWLGLLPLGISGGLLPCPSAVVVLLSAVALHRIAFGLMLIVAFSTGLAATLTATGILFVHARRAVERFRFKNSAVRFLPVASALLVTFMGIGFAAQGFSRLVPGF